MKKASWLVALLLAACASADKNNVDFLIDTTTEPAGANCAHGGLAITIGPDRNGDGALGPAEVTKTSYVCNGDVSATGHGDLSLVTPEAAGTNCAHGGLSVKTGPDTNANGILDPGEVKSTQYVCNGDAGLRSLIDVSTEAAGANCTAGGLKIDSGVDTNGNDTLDAGEVSDTAYVCNGDPVLANGTTPIVTAYADDFVTSPTNGSSVTARQATIAVPRQGRILVVWSADVFCASPAIGMGYDCGAGVNDAYLTATSTVTDAANTGDYSYLHLPPNLTESLSRSAVYTVANAGSYTFYLRASRGTTATSLFGVFRSQLTLAFTPD